MIVVGVLLLLLVTFLHMRKVARRRAALGALTQLVDGAPRPTLRWKVGDPWI